ATTDLAKACWAGGTIQIYINTTLPPGITYEAVRTAAIDAFQNLTDPNNPGKPVILKILKKEQLRNVDGSDSLHPNRSGDVVVVTMPPYQSDAGTNGQKIALSHFFGQHGFLPDYVNMTGNINMHATFVAGGPGIKHRDDVKGLRAIDIAPTIAFLMDIPGPQNARGRILYDIVKGAEPLTEVTILDISDYHGQLVPLSEAADTVGNHHFDRGQDYLRHTLIPLASYPFISSNIVDADGNTPAEWSPSHVFKFEHGVKLGMVGFSNDDLPELINPAGLVPFHVTN